MTLSPEQLVAFPPKQYNLSFWVELAVQSYCSWSRQFKCLSKAKLTKLSLPNCPPALAEMNSKLDITMATVSSSLALTVHGAIWSDR